jgi:hypothetical protein
MNGNGSPANVGPNDGLGPAAEAPTLVERLRTRPTGDPYLHMMVHEAADEIERLRDVLIRLQQWADAYPLDQFPEVLRQEWQQANEVLAQAGLNMSQMSASNMRHVLSGARKMLAEGLGA